MNLAQHLVASAQRHPDKAAFRSERETISFKELDTNSNRIANALTALGLVPGDVCLLMMPNSFEQITVYYALAKMGVVQVLANFLYRGNELEHIIADAKPKAFIGAEPYIEEVSKVFKKTGLPAIAVAKGASEDSGFINLARIYSENPDFPLYPSDDDDTLNILYT
ncbi:MAG: hypothetical protein E4H15_00875, partial [Syntrophobacterales bacterium]